MQAANVPKASCKQASYSVTCTALLGAIACPVLHQHSKASRTHRPSARVIQLAHLTMRRGEAQALASLQDTKQATSCKCCRRLRRCLCCNKTSWSSHGCPAHTAKRPSSRTPQYAQGVLLSTSITLGIEVAILSGVVYTPAPTQPNRSHQTNSQNAKLHTADQHQGRVQRASVGGGPAASSNTSSTSTARATPAPWNLSELHAFSRNASSRLIASRVILAAGSTGTDCLRRWEPLPPPVVVYTFERRLPVVPPC